MEFNIAQKQQKIFVLGATGFIGSALIKRLVSMGFTNIWGLYRSESKKNEIYRGIDTSAITFLQGDISQTAALWTGMENAAIVVNTTGLTTDWGPKSDYWQINIEAPQTLINLLEEKQPTTQYIYVSTATVYGFSSDTKTEKSPLVKSDRFYTASKVEMLMWLRQAKQTLNVPTTVILPPLVWGPGDQTFATTFRDRLESKQMIHWGEHKPIDFIHIDDLMDGILLCFFNKRARHQEFIFNGPAPFTNKAFIEKIAEAANLPSPRITIPISLALGVAWTMEMLASLINLFSPYFRPLLTRLQVFLLAEPLKLNTDHARRELGYQPKVDFETGSPGLEEYVQSLRFAGVDSKYKQQ